MLTNNTKDAILYFTTDLLLKISKVNKIERRYSVHLTQFYDQFDIILILFYTDKNKI